MLLDDSSDLDEVFCEHHEDVLLKHHDGTFTGHQVKTRQSNQPAWRANDDQVRTAFARFVRLECKYPGQFRRYCFVTNHHLQTGKNKHDLKHVLHAIRSVPDLGSVPVFASTWLRQIAKLAGQPEAIAYTALSKSEVRDDVPKLRDCIVRLVDTITQCWTPATDCSYGAVKRAATSLIDECGRASSLVHEQLLPAYLSELSTGDEVELARSIDGKRMTAPRVLAVLDAGRSQTATLEGDVDQLPRPGMGSTELLRRKLDAGGFSAVTAASAEDLRNKADYLGIQWTNKYGAQDGLKRYGHVCSVVLNDASRAFEATKNAGDDFGPAMREDLRQRFTLRRGSGYEFFGCSDEHLEGVAFSLTAQCKIVWSHARPWDDE